MSVLQTCAQGSSGAATVDIGDNVAYSLMLDSGSSQYLSKTFGSAGNRKTWTFSCWMKRGILSSGSRSIFSGPSGTPFFYSEFTSTDSIEVGFTGGSSAGWTTTAKFRDPSAWYHIVIVLDTTSATGTMAGSSTDRLRLYVNNVQYVMTGGTIPTLNADYQVNNNVAHYIGSQSGGSAYQGAYYANAIFIGGSALSPSDFGRTSADTGAWVNKTYAGSYSGTNSFFLDFSNSADLGNDVSGNNNDWTTNGGISSANQYTDTPTNNFCVLNPLDVYPVGAGTIAKGNTKVTVASSPDLAKGSMWASTGKWVAEMTVTTVGTTTMFCLLGDPANPNAGTGTYVGYLQSGNKEVNGSASAYGASYTTGDVIRAEWNADTGNLEFFKNGTSQGSISSVTGTRTFAVYMGASNVSTLNFGAQAWTGTPTSGFVGLSTANLTAPAIPKPSLYFDAKTRTGTGASYSVTGLNFQPDLVWVKGRSGATDHAIYDAVRGATYQLESNTTTDETTEATGLTAFNSDGYSGGALAQMNTNTATYIDWMWKESVTAGLDIVSYTGNGANRTINHGLGVVPKMIIIKSRTTAGADTNWAVYHASLANTEYLLLNSTAAKATGATYWNSTTPTNSVFSLGTHADVNTNSDTYIAYCFAEIEGFSKFGSYTGNASTDGVFVYCGFRPRWILTKASSTTGDWRIYDATRPGYNVQGGTLLADTSGAETTTAELDILSNGFKARITTDPNSAQTFIFAAFSELPMKYSTAR